MILQHGGQKDIYCIGPPVPYTGISLFYVRFAISWCGQMACWPGKFVESADWRNDFLIIESRSIE